MDVLSVLRNAHAESLNKGGSRIVGLRDLPVVGVTGY
jgi:hypothetical protein